MADNAQQGPKSSRLLILLRNTIILLLWGMAILSLLRFLRPAIADPADGLPGEPKAALEAARAHYRLPGIAAVLVTPDAVHSFAAGHTRLKGQSAASAEQLWHFGSNSKAITATLAALLVEQGRLGWDSSPAQVWPGHANAFHPQLSGVTLLELLQHRSGLAAYTSGLEFIGLPAFPGGPREEARGFALHILSQAPKGQRGDFVYSNAGYAVAGAMLAEAGGADFMTLLRQELLSPLGMRAEQGWPGLHGEEQPHGHIERFLWMVPHSPHDKYKLEGFMAPAGDLSISMPDYGLFLQLHLKGMLGIASELSGFTVSPELIALLHKPSGDYACGWGSSGEGELRRSVHDGSAGTFYCTTTICPDKRRAVCVVTNAATDSASRAVHALTEVLLAADIPAEP